MTPGRRSFEGAFKAQGKHIPSLPSTHIRYGSGSILLSIINHTQKVQDALFDPNCNTRKSSMTR